MTLVAMLAATAALNWTMPDGRVVAEEQELVPFEDGERIEVSREKILSMKAKRLRRTANTLLPRRSRKSFAAIRMRTSLSSTIAARLVRRMPIWRRYTANTRLTEVQ